MIGDMREVGQGGGDGYAGLEGMVSVAWGHGRFCHCDGSGDGGRAGGTGDVTIIIVRWWRG